MSFNSYLSEVTAVVHFDNRNVSGEGSLEQGAGLVHRCDCGNES